MADWTSGFDALRSALQFRAQQNAQKKQDQALEDYRNQTLDLERSRQEQLQKSNEAQEKYRQGTRDVVLVDRNSSPMNLKEAIEYTLVDENLQQFPGQ